jgi:HK97 family phage prohead protease
MTTETIQTAVTSIPNPSNWAEYYMPDDINNDQPVIFLEKATDGRTTLDDIEPALTEYKKLYKAGIASPAEVLTLSRAYPDNSTFSKALTKMKIGDDDSLVVGGPASIELVDREGHFITTDALGKAFKKYMDNFRTRNAMVLHSDVQVGWALPAYISKGGQIFKSGVDDKGLFFITELRNDTKIAKRVMEQIHEGKLRSYSIAGSATKTQNIQKGLQQVMQVDELELAEVTVCEKGVNQGASFEILKAEDAATSSCIDGSCLVSKEETHEKGVELMYKSNGDIDFTKSFLKFMNKGIFDDLGEDPFPSLKNEEGRRLVHRQFLAEYGFPADVDQESIRDAGIDEYDPMHPSPPWVVNDAGQNMKSTYMDSAMKEKMLERLSMAMNKAATKDKYMNKSVRKGVLGTASKIAAPMVAERVADKVLGTKAVKKMRIEKILPLAALAATPLAAGLASLVAGKLLSTRASKDNAKFKKSNIKTISKDVQIEKIGPLVAGLLGFGAGKFLDRKSTKASKDSVKSKKSNIKTISKDVKIEKIGPLAAAVLGFGASKLLSSKASRGTVKPKRKNIKTISKK